MQSMCLHTLMHTHRHIYKTAQIENGIWHGESLSGQLVSRIFGICLESVLASLRLSQNKFLSRIVEYVNKISKKNVLNPQKKVHHFTEHI